MDVRRWWGQLGEGQKRLILGAAAGEGALKIAAITDVVRRPAEQVRGPKWLWVVALVLVNSVGALPAVYFRLGRRPS